MRSALFTLLFLSAPLSLVHGGWLIEETTSYPGGPPASGKILIEGNAAKITAPGGITLILSGNQVALINPGAKAFWQGSLSEFLNVIPQTHHKLIASQEGEYWSGDYADDLGEDEDIDFSDLSEEDREMLQQMGVSEEDFNRDIQNMSKGMEVRVTSETAQVAGHPTRKVQVANQGELTEEIWISSKPGPAKDFDLVRLFTLRHTLEDPGNEMGQPTDEYWALYRKGYPLKTIQHSPWGESVETRVTSISTHAVPAAEFLVPSGLRKTDLQSLYTQMLTGGTKPGEDGGGFGQEGGWGNESGDWGSESDAWGSETATGTEDPDWGTGRVGSDSWSDEGDQEWSAEPEADSWPDGEQQTGGTDAWNQGGETIQGSSSGSGKLFKDPSGVFTIRHSSQWRAHCGQDGAETGCALLFASSNDPVILIAPVPVPQPGATGLHRTLLKLVQELGGQSASPTGAPTPVTCRSWSGGLQGMYLDTSGIGEDGRPQQARYMIVARGYVGVLLAGFSSSTRQESFGKHMNDVASTIEMAPDNRAMMQNLVGRWEGASTHKSMTFYGGDGSVISPGGNVSTEHIYVFYPGGRCESSDFVAAGMTTQSPGAFSGDDWSMSTTQGAGSQGSAIYTVVGSRVFIANPGTGEGALLNCSEPGVLGEGTIRYVRQ